MSSIGELLPRFEEVEIFGARTQKSLGNLHFTE